MSVDSRHPLYDEHREDWLQMRHTYRGERIVKEEGFRYLPPTSGMEADGLEKLEQKGRKAYDAYRKRARFPEAVREAVEALLGVMHRKPPTIQLPPTMEMLHDRATARNESLELLLRRVNEEQLVTGRVGILADVIDRGDRAGDPYLAMYEGEDVINWDEGRSDDLEVQNLNLVVIDETEFERVRGFTWEEVKKYRVLLLGDPSDTVEESTTSSARGNEPVENVAEGEGLYRAGVFREEKTTFTEERMVAPSIRGRTLSKIPFAFINSKDVVAEPDEPPLLGLSNLALAIYRGEADYRQALFMQGQDTLVVIGGGDDDEHRTGAGASINLTIGGDAKFIGVDSSGLSEMREALVNDYDRAAQKGGQLLDNTGGDKESGEALRVRVAARTATLTQVALAGAAGLQHVLRIVAEWLGADPEEVVVTPNLDFVDDQMTGEQLSQYMSAKMMGAPISLRTIHELMEDRGATSRTFEEELEEMAEEGKLDVPGLMTGMMADEGAPGDQSGSTNPDGPAREDDGQEDDSANEPQPAGAAAE
jgi:hypothetical protein